MTGKPNQMYYYACFGMTFQFYAQLVEGNNCESLFSIFQKEKKNKPKNEEKKLQEQANKQRKCSSYNVYWKFYL